MAVSTRPVKGITRTRYASNRDRHSALSGESAFAVSLQVEPVPLPIEETPGYVQSAE